MADPGGSQAGGRYGATNGSYGQQWQETGQEREMNPFTLQQALPYSPQTSVIPFTSGLSPPLLLTREE